MPDIERCALPPDALLRRYLERGYTDAYCADVPYAVTHAEYVEAFYTTWLFGLERWLLARLVSKPSTDAQARALSRGADEPFAAWRVEERAQDQVLLSDFRGQTRSWLMIAPQGDASPRTRLFFGSAVVHAIDTKTGQATLGFVYRALLGFHRLYSRALLAASIARLGRGR